jgi:hypothetical protein
MTNDSRLFPPRPKWEEQGYRPDEYSRWFKGDWRPIAELWAELDVSPLPEGELRCAQPPYDTLPIPRADILPGIILSRGADALIREERIDDVALPLYEGRMIGQLDFSQKGWVSGKGRGAVWRSIEWGSKRFEPQYMMAIETCKQQNVLGFKLPLMNISSSTNSRTLISAFAKDLPCNHSLNPLRAPDPVGSLVLAVLLNSFLLDALVRVRLGGLNVSFFVLDEVACVKAQKPFIMTLAFLSDPLSLANICFADAWISLVRPGLTEASWRSLWAARDAERRRMLSASNCVVALFAGLSLKDLGWILRDCDLPTADVGDSSENLSPMGFWRVDKDKDPELRHTVLTLVAFRDLEAKIRACGGDREKGIEAFLNQNEGEGWMLPETLRLADYGLGHDERAKEHQPVASRFGPRFYD